jgi:uncharacterized protein
MVHTFRFNGKNIVLDVNSGTVHVFSDSAYEAICGGDVPPEIRDEFAELEKQGLLFSKDITDEVVALAQSREPVVKALCLLVAQDCNLRCAYCFAGEGLYLGERGLMTAETARKAVDFLITQSGKRRNLEIDFFGGEPLLALDTVKHTVEYAKRVAPEKVFRFTLTTNGLLLDEETIQYLNLEMDNLVLSLDGRREVNDRHRGKTYDTLLPMYKRVVETRTGDYYVRGTFTRENLDFCEDVLHLASLGFRNISIEPAVLPPGHPLALTEGDLPRICAEYEKLCKVMEEGADFSFFHFNVDLTQGPCVYKRLRGCGAGVEYAAVTPEGDVYPCHQFAGRQEWKMGNVSDGDFSEKISSDLKKMDANGREECRTCWAKYFCGGGCAAANLTVNGEFTRPDRLGCELVKKRLSCAIYLKTVQMCD